MNLLTKPIRIKYPAENNQTMNMTVGRTYWAIALVSENGYLKYVVINDRNTVELVPAHEYPVDLSSIDIPTELPNIAVAAAKLVEEETEKEPVQLPPKEEQARMEAAKGKKDFFEVKRVRK